MKRKKCLWPTIPSILSNANARATPRTGMSPQVRMHSRKSVLIIALILAFLFSLAVGGCAKGEASPRNDPSVSMTSSSPAGY